MANEETAHEKSARSVLEHLHGYNPAAATDEPAKAFEHDRHLLASVIAAAERKGYVAGEAQSRPVKDAATGDRVTRLPETWRSRGMYLTNIRALPGPAPESVALYQCARDLEQALAVPFVPAGTPAGQWIRCEERMPDGGRVVLVFDVSQGVVMLAWRDRSNLVWFPAGGLARPLAAEVTHWMPLPPAPESRGFDDSKPGVNGPPDFHANRNDR